MKRIALTMIFKVKWAGAGALLFATGLLAAAQTGVVSIDRLTQQPENFVVLFSVLGGLLGIWIVSSLKCNSSSRNRYISKICLILTAVFAALSVEHIQSISHDALQLGSELILAVALAICGAFLGWFLNSYLKAKLQSD